MPVTTMTKAQLIWARTDLNEVIECQEAMAKAGFRTPKLGHYWDELHAVVGELQKRKQRRISRCPTCGK